MACNHTINFSKISKIIIYVYIVHKSTFTLHIYLPVYVPALVVSTYNLRLLPAKRVHQPRIVVICVEIKIIIKYKNCIRLANTAHKRLLTPACCGVVKIIISFFYLVSIFHLSISNEHTCLLHTRKKLKIIALSFWQL